MCGLLAIFTNDPSSNLAPHAMEMLRTMRHRGPDDTHLVSFVRGSLTPSDQPADTALGLNRLAIQDLSQAGRQPMSDPTGRYWIVFNGEIYNFLELRADLQARGEQFVTGTDTEVLLRLLSMRGIEALALLDGMFAFVLLDTHERRVTAVRDRFGIKPLYYWRSPKGDLCIASEIKAFTAHPEWNPTLNRQRAFDFLSRGLIDHTAETMFEQVEQIRGGHLATFQLADLDSFRVSDWYELLPSSFAGSTARAAQEWLSLFDDSVRLRLRADVAVGSCLSGGLDSSAIVCSASHELLKSSPSTNQKTFTARNSDPTQDEWSYARAVADVAQVEALEVYPDGAELLDRLDELVWIQDEPFASTSIYAQYCVFRAAHRHGVTVMLDGQGADEQLAGYHSFFKVRLLELLRRGRLIQFLGELRNISNVHKYPMLRLVAQTLSALRPIRSPGSRRIASRLLNAPAFGDHLPDPFHIMPGQQRGVRAFSLEQLQAGSLPMLLHWEDRNSMAHGIEARVPFLSHHLVEFVLGLPSELKIRGAMTKVILREAMTDRLPQSVLNRTDKIAFATPEASWMCSNPTNRVQTRLDESVDLMGSLLVANSRELLDSMIRGETPYDPWLFRIMCFGAWIRRFNVALD